MELCLHHLPTFYNATRPTLGHARWWLLPLQEHRRLMTTGQTLIDNLTADFACRALQRPPAFAPRQTESTAKKEQTSSASCICVHETTSLLRLHWTVACPLSNPPPRSTISMMAKQKWVSPSPDATTAIEPNAVEIRFPAALFLRQATPRRLRSRSSSPPLVRLVA